MENTLLTFFPALTVLIIISFCGAILGFVGFFRQVNLEASRAGAFFAIPLLLISYGFLLVPSLPTGRIIYIGEAVLALSLLILLISKAQPAQNSLLLLSIFMGVGGGILLQKFSSLPLLNQEPKYYAIAAFAPTLLLVILSRNKKGLGLLQSFAFLAASQLLALFDQIIALAACALLLKIVFFVQVSHQIFKAIHEEVTKEVHEARKIQKDFNEELRKEVKKHVFYMELSQKKMAKISQTDALTEAYNRKGILDVIDKLVDDRTVKQFSLLLFDIDKFKNVNDTLGHVTGDQCLKTLAHIARGNMRENDSLGRYGGDEFIIALPHADTETAFKVAERFRAKVAETDSPHFTISIGISTFPMDGMTHKQLMEYADLGLYMSKERGRNAVSRKTPTPVAARF